MSTTSVSPPQRLRIAIAIAALKFKPPELSYETYTLELQRHFCSIASTKSITEERDAWRERALQLEAELRATQTAATTEAIGYLLRKQPLPSSETDATEPTLPTSTRGRKKTKKPPKKLNAKRTEAPQIGEVFPSGNKPPRSSPGTNRGIFSSLHGLDDIASRIATKSTPLDAAQVVAATIRCIDVLHALLGAATSTASVPPIPEDATPQEAIDGIEHILQHILRTVILALHGAYIDSSTAAGLQWHASPAGDEPVYPFQTASALDLVLARVMTGVVVPAIRALAPCTLAKTEHILSAPRHGSPEKRDFADGAQLLSLISAILDALPDQKYIALYDRVALETVRELTSLITDRSSRVTHPRLTPAQRIHRIASKDALHFLCDAALLALRRSPSTPAPPESREEMLRAALGEALGDLALTQSVCEGAENGLDVVEEHRVMAVLERAWSVGLRVGHIGGDGDVAMMDVDYGPKEHQLSSISDF